MGRNAKMDVGIKFGQKKKEKKKKKKRKKKVIHFGVLRPGLKVRLSTISKSVLVRVFALMLMIEVWSCTQTSKFNFCFKKSKQNCRRSMPPRTFFSTTHYCPSFDHQVYYPSHLACFNKCQPRTNFAPKAVKLPPLPPISLSIYSTQLISASLFMTPIHKRNLKLTIPKRLQPAPIQSLQLHVITP